MTHSLKEEVKRFSSSGSKKMQIGHFRLGMRWPLMKTHLKHRPFAIAMCADFVCLLIVFYQIEERLKDLRLWIAASVLTDSKHEMRNF